MLDINRIDQARRRKGWLKKDLARVVGIHPVSLSRILRGDIQNPKTIKAICDALNLSTSDVYLEGRAEVA